MRYKTGYVIIGWFRDMNIPCYYTDKYPYRTSGGRQVLTSITWDSDIKKAKFFSRRTDAIRVRKNNCFMSIIHRLHIVKMNKAVILVDKVMRS